MTRRIVIVIGAALLSVAGLGLIGCVVWLIAALVSRIPPYILEARLEAMMYMLPALVIAVAFLGAGLMADALASRHKSPKSPRDLHLHT
jgi:ABC-type Na+ efflux pump permease subunit